MKKLWYLIVSLAMLGTGGCDIFLGPNTPVGTGTLNIGFGVNGGARAVSAEEQAALRYDLDLSGPDSQKITVSLSPGEAFSRQVALGEWRITAKAFSPEGSLFGSGETVIIVRAGANQARIPMRTIPDIQVSALDLSGLVSAPETGGSASIVEIDGPQYAGAGIWQDASGTEVEVDGIFAASTVYQAVVTLTAKTGYTFAGLDENSFSYDGATSITSAVNDRYVTVTIKFPATGNLPHHTIIFKSNYDTDAILDRKTVFGTAAIGAEDFPADPTRLGYNFGGWNPQTDGSGEPFTDGTIVDDDMTVYAQWTAITYTVVYNKNADDASGATASSTHIYDAESPLTANDFTRSGYFFAGWDTQAGGGGTSYNDGQSVSNLSSTQGATVTLYAKWTNIIYTVTFESHGGSTVTAIQGAAGTQPTRPIDPTRNGYTFQGWYTEETGGTEYSWPHTLAADVTMHAQWTVVNYTITYNNLTEGSNGTGNPDTYTIESGAITLADATRNGYTFGGWYSDSGFAMPVTGIPASSTGDKVFYAKWTPITYTVKYNANGGSGTTSSSDHTYGVYQYLTANVFIKTGYSFGGWNTQANGAGTPYGDEANVANLSSIDGAEVNLYAKWTLNSYNITYNLNNGTNGATNPASYTVESLPITLADATRSGYTFGGWYENSAFTGSAVTSIPTGSTEDITLYAKWNPGALVQITLQPDPDDPPLSNVSIFEDQSALFEATGTGYAFWEWYWNGTLQLSGADAGAYTLAADSQSSGIYELSVVVTTDEGVKLSARCRVTVNAKQGGV
jgi:uncharacterized repeat protein (TIGR02543 family)